MHRARSVRAGSPTSSPRSPARRSPPAPPAAHSAPPCPRRWRCRWVASCPEPSGYAPVGSVDDDTASRVSGFADLASLSLLPSEVSVTFRPVSLHQPCCPPHLGTGRLCSTGSGCLPFPDVIAPIRPSDSLIPVGRCCGLVPRLTAYLGAGACSAPCRLRRSCRPCAHPRLRTARRGFLRWLPVGPVSPQER